MFEQEGGGDRWLQGVSSYLSLKIHRFAARQSRCRPLWPPEAERASRRDGAVALSGDEQGIILGQLRNALEPRLVMYFSSAKELRALLPAEARQQLQAMRGGPALPQGGHAGLRAARGDGGLWVRDGPLQPTWRRWPSWARCCQRSRAGPHGRLSLGRPGRCVAAGGGWSGLAAGRGLSFFQ